MLKRNWRAIFVVITILFDITAVITSFLFAYFLRFSVPVTFEYSFKEYALLCIYSFLVFFILAVLLGLYREAFRSEIKHQYITAAKAYAYSLIIIPVMLFFLRNVYHSRIFIVLFWGSLPFFFLLFRSALKRFNIFMQNKGYGRENVIIFGLNENVKEAIRRFEEFPELGYQIKDTIIKQDNSNGKVNNNFYVQLQEIIKEKKVDHIFLTDSHFARTDISEILNIAVKNNTKVKILSNESDEILACSRIHDVTGISLYVPKRYRIEAVNKVLKRSFDIIASSILIIAISPLFFVISLLILVESRGKGSIIFRQKRALAKGAKEFYFYKFRSMIVNADELKEQLANLNESNGALFKIKDDPRITKVGKFIRKWSLDELPQLFNVLKGDMSLVGPRPLPISDFEKLNFDNNVQRFYTKRAEAKPGITGLWQISGRSKLGFEDMILLDLYYIENQSILFDIELLFETVPAVLFGRGAY